MKETVTIDPKFDKKIRELLVERAETVHSMPISVASGSVKPLLDAIDTELEKLYAARRQAYKNAGAMWLRNL